MTPVRLLELSVGRTYLLRLEYRERATTKELRPAHPPSAGQLVELAHEVVIELHQDFATSHDHMVDHMETRTTATGVWLGVRATYLPGSREIELVAAPVACATERAGGTITTLRTRMELR